MPTIAAPVVTTASGDVRGTDDGRVAVWKGIRYAQPPIGDLRWRAPVAAEPWAGVADATAFGAAAPQRISPAIPLGDDIRMDEDCLFLNVWRRSGSGTGLRPVMVWLHGGAYTFGSASQTVYDGTALVTHGDVVVVTINYRLGALGFLDLSSLLPGAEANPALRDVLLALRWVQDNIRAFGGDPGRVTLFGESAGGGLVTALLATPSAEGLFQRAIAQSAPASSMYGAQRAATVAARFAEAAGVSGDPPALSALTTDQIVAAAAVVYDAVPRENPGRLAFAPVVDGDLLPEPPIAVLSEGRGLAVPLIIGTNRDEATMFKFMKSPLVPIEAESIERMFADMREEQPELAAPSRDQVLTAYAKARRRGLGVGIARDIGFRMPTVWVAAGHATIAPTYLYRFDHATPILTLAGIGAAHAAELPYVWGTIAASPKQLFRLGGRRAAERISRRMLHRWTEFANGRPPGGDWPAYAPEARATLVIDRTDRIVPDLDDALRTGWGETVLSFR